MEDDFTYVIRKALRGLNLAPGEAASLAGLAESEVMSLLRGRFSADAAKRLAPVLSLDPDALASLPGYQPAELRMDSVTCLDLPFEDGQVNAWLIRATGLTILFDTGFSATSLATALDAIGVTRLDATFITHDHRDHVGGLNEAGRRGPAPASMKVGETMTIGPLVLQAFDLSGHGQDALGYLIHGLERQVCVVGDALFAGSIGGCAPEVYSTALSNLRRGIFSLPDSTILLPGHGPATTVGEERRSNPFFP